MISGMSVYAQPVSRQCSTGPHLASSLGVCYSNDLWRNISACTACVRQLRSEPRCANMLQVAKFLDAGMKRLQTVDSNEGSNI